MEPPLHEAVEPIAFLLGTWRGRGKGHYPTIEPFEYGEEARFWHVGKPFLAYSQRTWSLQDGAPLHAETGYWRPQEDGRVEVVIAHPFGIVEVEGGRVEGRRLVLESEKLAATPTAQRVDAVARTIEVDGDRLYYSLDMAAVGESLRRHLQAELKKVNET